MKRITRRRKGQNNRFEMNVAIVHYHLNPGGVTRIIGSQVRGLAGSGHSCRVRVLCGNNIARTVLEDVPVMEFKCLDYVRENGRGDNPDDRSPEIMSVLHDNAAGHILHCHNPNLGKNPALTLALYRLAGEGFRVVNHCHDFAEDRPANLKALSRMADSVNLPLQELLYPGFPLYHFIVLNAADHRRILDAGIPGERVHLVHNPVSVPAEIPANGKQELRRQIIRTLGLNPGRRICTYPVRAIGRKNLGELILLAVLFENTFQFVVTQAPRNPEEIPGYERWKRYCAERGIRIIFEAGDAVDHEELIGISDFCITTSTREGFGMVFLEPWIAGTPVSGRDLPGITGDLKGYGLEFPGLYREILVESGEGIQDFAALGREGQEDVIGRARVAPEERDRLRRMNPFLDRLFPDIEPGMLERNRQIILEHFSVSGYGQRLFEIYKTLS